MDEYIRNEARMSKAAAEKKVKAPKTLTDLQKLKVEKLMSKPDKPVYIPEPKKEWKPRDAPEFVRDVMGSSAGAGSGEFHVYRHIRRREFAREAHLDKMDKKQKMDEEFEAKLKENREKAEAATAKKRAKRQRRKQKIQYNKQKLKKQNGAKEEAESKDSESDNEAEQDNKEEKKEDDAEEQSFVMGGR